ncbi:MAG: glycosyltransferase family 9 protein [Calditrichaeota bacterium]|nr:glycosyltransferase family 9 protein [Calditrichota bacterium]
MIIKLRAIGDVVLATPVIENLRRAFPHAAIHFLTESPSAPLVQNHPGIDQVIVYPRQRLENEPIFRRWFFDSRFLWKLRAEQYDLVLDLFGNPRSAIMTRLSGAPRRVGYNFRGRKAAYTRVVTNRGADVHEVEFNLDALRALQIPVVNHQPKIFVSEEDREFIRNWIGQNQLTDRLLIGLNPSGSWPAKRWPDEKFVQVGKRLRDRFSATVVVLWGPGEKETAQKITAGIGEGALLAPQTTLLQLAALCEKMTLLVSNDSGPMHISAAMGTPTLGIYGPTRSNLQGPYGEKARAVAHWQIPCLGCNRLTCPLLDCMNYLTVEEVFEEAVNLWGQIPADFR